MHEIGLTLAIGFTLAVAFGCVPSAKAHSWYEGFKAPGTDISCCNTRDCKPASAFGVEIEPRVDGFLITFPTGEETLFPYAKVLPSQDMNYHLCAPWPGEVRCLFAPGSV